jgi:hypothetical protein
MAKNKLSDLRDHLFETIEALKDREKPMDIDRAKAISTVAQTVIDTARVELKACEVLGVENESDFFPMSPLDRAARARRSLDSGSKQ